jgi:Fur family ferric uptake transcriptional regulator
VCQQTYCLDGVELPKPAVPQGFEIHSVNYIIKGICPHCQSES